MTLSLPPNRRYTVEEYLELDEASPQAKLEYREGAIVNMREALAMAGGSINHGLITVNVSGELRSRLKGGDCRVHSSDVRIRIPSKRLYTYPDVSVACGESQVESGPSGGQTLLNPRLITEILSPSTEDYDRGRKFELYRDIPSLREYVLVWQTEARVQTFFRHDDGGWFFDAFAGTDAVARLLSLGIDLPLAEVYAKITLPPLPPEPETGPA
jgi:Uma2 family endonuclease